MEPLRPTPVQELLAELYGRTRTGEVDWTAEDDALVCRVGAATLSMTVGSEPRSDAQADLFFTVTGRRPAATYVVLRVYRPLGSEQETVLLVDSRRFGPGVEMGLGALLELVREAVDAPPRAIDELLAELRCAG
jgi:hypothetical protein